MADPSGQQRSWLHLALAFSGGLGVGLGLAGGLALFTRPAPPSLRLEDIARRIPAPDHEPTWNPPAAFPSPPLAAPIAGTDRTSPAPTHGSPIPTDAWRPQLLRLSGLLPEDRPPVESWTQEIPRQALIAALGSSEPGERLAAITAIAWSYDYRSVPALLRLLGDTLPTVRERAVAALIALRDRRALEELLTRYLRETDQRVRQELLRALRALTHLPLEPGEELASQVSAFLEREGHRSPAQWLALDVERAIADLAGPEAAAALDFLRRLGGPQAGPAAGNAEMLVNGWATWWKRVGPEGLVPLGLDHLGQAQPERRQSGLWLLSYLGERVQPDLVVDGLRAADPGVRAASYQLLRNLADRDLGFPIDGDLQAQEAAARRWEAWAHDPRSALDK